MSDIEKKRRGRPSANKDSISDNSNQSNDNADDLQNTVRKRTLTVPKSVETEEEEETGEESSVSEESSNDKDMTDFDKQLEKELEKEFESTENNNDNDIPDEDSDPLKPNVKDRVYTDGINTNINSNGNSNSNIENAQIVEEREIGEPEYKGGGKALPDVDDTLVHPNANSDTKTNFNDIPPSNDGGGSGGGNKNTTSNTTSNSGTPKSEPKTEKKEEPKQEKSDNLKELSPKEKREAIEKTADVILLAYQQYCPVPFVYFSEYSEKKLEKLHDNNEIDLETPVKRDGTTFRQYVAKFNLEVEEKFVVTDKEIEELREPLIDVLSEQEIAFTPTQRLLFTLGQQLAGKIFLTVKFLREKHSDMKQMREMHQERMEQMERVRVQYEKQHKKNHPNNQQNVNQNVNVNPEGYKHPPTNNNDIKVTEEQQPVTPVTPVENVQNQEQDNSNSEEKNITEAKVVEMKPKNNKNTITNTPTLDDVLEGKDESEEEESNDKKDEENDIPNE